MHSFNLNKQEAILLLDCLDAVIYGDQKDANIQKKLRNQVYRRYQYLENKSASNDLKLLKRSQHLAVTDN